MPDGKALVESVARLLEAAEARPPSAAERERINTAMKDCDLDKPDAVPSWAIELMAAIAARLPTADWVRFKLRGLDDSDTLSFLREELPALVPMEFEDREESWVMRFPALAVRATITFEGYSYLVEREPAKRP